MAFLQKILNLIKSFGSLTKRMLIFIIFKPFLWLRSKNVFKISLYAAGLTFLFSISQNLSLSSRLSFQFKSYAGDIIDRKASPLMYGTRHEGMIVNRSSAKNTITNISLLVWNDATKRDGILRDSFGPTKMVDRRNGKEIKLPLVIEGREAIAVEIYNNFIFEGIDKELLLAMEPTQPGSIFLQHKHDYELTFSDINGNEFTESGEPVNRDVVDLNWTLSNFCGQDRYKPWPCRKEKGKIGYVKVVFKIRNMLSWFGLENVGNLFYNAAIPRSWVTRP
jgi:hypothetical protein